MTKETMMIACTNRIVECFDIVEKLWNVKLIRPKIRFDLTGVTFAGLAYLNYNEINLNLEMAMKFPDFLANTPGHEAAHLIAHQLYGSNIKPHGTQWKRIMRFLNQEPERTHEYILETEYKYQCNCQIHYLTKRKHNRIVNKKSRYKCNFCHSELKQMA
jgi:SprT protein